VLKELYKTAVSKLQQAVMIIPGKKTDEEKTPRLN
jgi:hypothetical protein